MVGLTIPEVRTAEAAGVRVIAARAAQREVVAALALEPRTGRDLMEVLRLGEGQVRAALQALRDSGQVHARDYTGGGWGGVLWSVV